MKEFNSINENELDGALNALFLETYSYKTDDGLARFVIEQEYNITINSKKEAELISRLNGKQGGGKNIFLWALALLLINTTSIVLYNTKSDNLPKGQTVVSSTTKPSGANSNEELNQTAATTSSSSKEEKEKTKIFENASPLISIAPEPISDNGLPITEPATTKAPSNPSEEKVLPYFNKEGLAYFAKVKEQMLKKLLKIDDVLYAKTAPGATMYKNQEVLVAPFVMSNFPVTNLQYKTFLADLVTQGRFEDMKKCLPKEEVWKESGCNALAKNYFSNEMYNDFPVVNIDKEACVIFCQWLEESKVIGIHKNFQNKRGS